MFLLQIAGIDKDHIITCGSQRIANNWVIKNNN